MTNLYNTLILRNLCGPSSSLNFIDQLNNIFAGGMLCPGRVANLVHYMLDSSTKPGDMVEFGCNEGHTAILMASMVDKSLWVYDSFEGMPAPTEKDAGLREWCVKGYLAADFNAVRARFEELDLCRVYVQKSWFNQLEARQLPDNICFAHLDGDMYDSIRVSLNLVWPRLVKGGACVIDDYGWNGAPGVKVAVDEFLNIQMARVAQFKRLVTGNIRSFQAVFIK